MEVLELYNNQITGTIPASLGSLPAVSFVKLYGNKLSGTLPSSLCSLSTAVELYSYVCVHSSTVRRVNHVCMYRYVVSALACS